LALVLGLGVLLLPLLAPELVSGSNGCECR
jgi:hypothetical protein